MQKVISKKKSGVQDSGTNQIPLQQRLASSSSRSKIRTVRDVSFADDLTEGHPRPFAPPPPPVYVPTDELTQSSFAPSAPPLPEQTVSPPSSSPELGVSEFEEEQKELLPPFKQISEDQLDTRPHDPSQQYYDPQSLQALNYIVDQVNHMTHPFLFF